MYPLVNAVIIKELVSCRLIAQQFSNIILLIALSIHNSLMVKDDDIINAKNILNSYHSLFNGAEW